MPFDSALSLPGVSAFRETVLESGVVAPFEVEGEMVIC